MAYHRQACTRKLYWMIVGMLLHSNKKWARFTRLCTTIGTRGCMRQRNEKHLHTMHARIINTPSVGTCEKFQDLQRSVALQATHFSSCQNPLFSLLAPAVEFCFLSTHNLASIRAGIKSL